MATLRIPVASDRPRFRQRTRLDGAEFVLAFRWSMRESRWYLEIRSPDDALIAGPIKLVANFGLLGSRRAPGLPPGELYALDGRTSPSDPGIDELGSVVDLVYVEAEAAA